MKGYLQGDVLSLLLWYILIDTLIYEVQNLPMHAQVYTDDAAMLAADRDFETVFKNVQLAADLIDSLYLKHMSI